MLRLTNCVAILLLFLCLSSCNHQTNTERAETTLWNGRCIDSSYGLLYADKDTTRALHYFDSCLQQAENASVYPNAARFGLLANYYYFFSSDNHSTARMIDKALGLYNTPELQNHYAHSYVGLLLFGGHIAYRLTQYSKANDYYFRAKKLADAYLDPCEKTAFNYNIAMVLFRQQNFRASLRYFSEAYALQASCAPQTTAVVLQQQEIQGNIGECYVHLKGYDSALLHFDKALRIADANKDSLGGPTVDKIYGVIYGDVAKVARERGHLEEAAALALKSIVLNDRPGYEVENAMQVKLLLADIYSQKADLAPMWKTLRELQGPVRDNPPLQLEWRRLIASYYEQRGQPDLALRFSKSYYALRDSLAGVQKELTEADIARQLGEKEQEHQIVVLKKDQHITVMALWMMILFAGMTLVILYLIFQHYRRSKKGLALSLALNEEIRQQKAARESEARERHRLITEAVIRAQETERSFIGRELHDNVGQVLTTIKLHHEMLLEGTGDPKVLLPRTVNYLQHCINEIRSLSRRLSAPTLGKISLGESIQDLIDSINVSSKVKITRQISGLENGMLQQDLHLGVYRIVQEQLTNVLKHAEASEVVVEIERRDCAIRLCITDNGKGFLVQESKSGIGLMNMQTRAENLSGTFELSSRPGHGCRVEVIVPCLQ